MKKRLAILIALLLTVTMIFTACGEQKKPGTSQGNAGTQQATDKGTTVAAGKETTANKGTADANKPAEKGEYLTMTQEQALAIKASENHEPKGQVIIGDSTETSGEFVNGWSNASTDAQLKNLIGGYGLVYVDQAGGYHVDPTVVKSFKAEDNKDGSRTYTFTVYDNLKFNDGTAINIDNFLADFLMSSSWQFGSGAVGANNTSGDRLVGFEEFHKTPEDFDKKQAEIAEKNAAIEAENDALREKYPDKEDSEIPGIKELLPMPTDAKGGTVPFKGIHRIDDYTGSVTVAAENLPYYYELSLLGYGALPTHVVCPGVKLKDDGEGCYFSEEFTVELLNKTYNTPKTGFRYAPTVGSGAYSFISYDPGTKERKLEANPNFIGNFEGKKPNIKTILFKRVTNKTQMDELKTGSVDLLAPINGKESIESGIKVAEDSNEKITFTTFNRNGYGYIGFQCDMSPTQYKEVRQGIAHLLDRDAFLDQYAGPYAKKVHSMYGLGQKEYQVNADAIEEKMNQYTFNPNAAVELFEKAGFTLNEKGEAYTSGLRYKEITDPKELPPAGGPLDKMIVKVGDKKLMPLKINWINTPDNPVSELIRTLLLPEAKKVGMEITDTTKDFNVLYDHFMRKGNNMPPEQIEYTMFNLATGFGDILAFWDDVNPGKDYLGYYNMSFIPDDSLFKLAMDMYHADSKNPQTFYDAWLKFELAYNDYMAQLPLYSDIYHVFYNSRIKNYNQSTLWDYGRALVYADVQD